MPFLSFSSSQPQTLTVFHGTLASILRSGGEQVSAPGEFRLAVRLDGEKYKTILKNPLLETAIIEAVAKKMVTEVAPQLAKYYRANGRVSQIAQPLQEAIAAAPRWVNDAYNTQAPIIQSWRKNRCDQSVAALKSMLSIATATVGVVTAAPTFGATSIPAVFALWSAVSDLAGLMQQSWQSVTEAEKAVIAQARAIDQYYTSSNSALKGLPPTIGLKRSIAITEANFPSQAGGPAAAGATGFHKMAAFGKNAVGTVAKSLGAGPIMNAVGVTGGPSVQGFESALKNYEMKLTHLVHTANNLTGLLMEILIQNDQLAHSTAVADVEKLKANEALVAQIIGSERGGGIHRVRSGYRNKVSILWLVAYAERGIEFSKALRSDMATRLMDSGLKTLRGTEAVISFALTLAKWVGDNQAAIWGGSLVKFGQEMKILDKQEDLQFQGVRDASTTLMSWIVESLEIKKAFSGDASDLEKSEIILSIKEDYKPDAAGAVKESYKSIQELYDKIQDMKSSQ
ncbi:hypothetical protein [Sphingomonas sp. PAMC 26605]|uniref:hypothetical protein n=1 Tax=Sphingomonas sp. PAMC 26605 TaxID=1112214 RepID=UPI00026CD1D1|nr:hypothetical protein [Sphingomonas sp. PAMC 26605]